MNYEADSRACMSCRFISSPMSIYAPPESGADPPPDQHFERCQSS